MAWRRRGAGNGAQLGGRKRKMAWRLQPALVAGDEGVWLAGCCRHEKAVGENSSRRGEEAAVMLKTAPISAGVAAALYGGNEKKWRRGARRKSSAA